MIHVFVRRWVVRYCRPGLSQAIARLRMMQSSARLRSPAVLQTAFGLLRLNHWAGYISSLTCGYNSSMTMRRVLCMKMDRPVSSSRVAASSFPLLSFVSSSILLRGAGPHMSDPGRYITPTRRTRSPVHIVLPPRTAQSRPNRPPSNPSHRLPSLSRCPSSLLPRLQNHTPLLPQLLQTPFPHTLPYSRIKHLSNPSAFFRTALEIPSRPDLFRDLFAFEGCDGRGTLCGHEGLRLGVGAQVRFCAD